MKTNFKTCLLLLLMMSVSTLSFAKPRHTGYHWVIETTDQAETYTVFRIYQHDNQLVYEEKIPGKKLDIRKKSVRRQLDKGLSLYMQSVEQFTKVDNQNLLKSIAFR